MARLNAMLEPGERVAAVGPPMWPVVPIGLYLIATVLTSALMVAEAGALDDPAFRAALGLMAFLCLALIVFLILMARWRVAVTDRRVLVRNGFLRRDLEEMPRNIVDSVTHRDFTLEFGGGGRRISTKLHPLLAERIIALFDACGEARGRYARPFARLRVPGERVLFRSGGRVLLAIQALTSVLILSAVGMVLAVVGSSFAMASALQVGAFFFAMLALSWSAVAFSEKRWLVTDRRVLTVAGLLLRRVEDLPLTPDTEAALDDAALTVRNGDRILVLPLTNDPDKRIAAQNILEAIEAAKGAA